MAGNDCGNGNLPHDVMINILKRLPIKSLFRFKCVVKDWYNLFKSPYFISLHLHHSTPFLLFQRIPKSSQSSSSSCLIAPDFKVHTLQFIDFASHARIIGSCNGLLCLKQTNNPNLLSIWNPATREFKQVPTGTLICNTKSFYCVGFGFSPVVNDYKVVRICIDESYDDGDDRIVVLLDSICVSRAEVYSLTTGSWKEVDATNLQNLYPMSNSVTASGIMFWEATMVGSVAEFVVSFDIGDEKFTLLKGPPTPTDSTHSRSNVLAVHNNKLAMFRRFIIGNHKSCSVDLWVLEDLVGERWVKQYSVGPFSRIFYPLSIWSDEIVCRENEYSVQTSMSLFNPYSNEMKNLPAQRDAYYSACFNYAESLVPVANIRHEQPRFAAPSPCTKPHLAQRRPLTQRRRLPP